MAAVARVARKVLQFPHHMKIAGSGGEISIVVHEFNDSHFDRAHQLFQQAADNGDGYSKEEVERERLRKKLTTNKTLTFMEEKSQEIVCIVPITDSMACRSTRPMLATTFSVVDPSFRGQGLIRDAYRVTFPVTIAMGYLGFTARVALTARNIVPCLAVGGEIMGTFPMSNKLEKVGFIDDVVIFLNHNLDQRMPEYYAELCKRREVPLPPLSEDKATLEGLCAWNDLPKKEVKTQLGTMRIRPVQNVKEVLEVERMIRASAEKGQGFGIDEFDDNGHFNRKFFHSTDIAVAESTDGDIMGCALLGPSHQSRMAKPIIAHQYMVVKEKYSGNGIATALINYSAETVKSQGYKMLVSDTYLTDLKMISMLRNRKWLFRGSLRVPGFLKGIGPTDSLIVSLTL